MNRTLAFLKTKIGVALTVAVLLVIGSVVYKIMYGGTTTDLNAKVGLIADATIKKTLESGDLGLNLLTGSTTSDFDAAIATLQPPESTTTSDNNLTATDRFSREFFTKYMELKQSGAAIDENTGMNLVNQLLAKDYGGPAEEKIYTSLDIKSSSTQNLSDLKQYGNTIGAIINTPLPTGYEQEMAIVTKVNVSGDPTELAKLEPNIKRYESIRDRLLAVSVPTPLVAAHTALVNSISAMLEGVKGMTLIDTDPVGATKMIARYQDGIQSLDFPLLQIGIYLKKQNISFSSNESGYILMQ